MGYYLKEIAGIDPLTIEQTFGDFKSIFLRNHYLAINADTTRKNQCDFFIYNNLKENDFLNKYETNILDFSVSLSKKVIKEIKRSQKVMLTVYHTQEFDAYRFKAVPLINYLIECLQGPRLKLSPGRYVLLIRYLAGEVIAEQKVNI